jgi:hypothetical protein
MDKETYYPHCFRKYRSPSVGRNIVLGEPAAFFTAKVLLAG